MDTEGLTVVQRIMLGECDDELGDIVDAIDTRIKAGAAEIGWRIEFDGLTIDTENQTVAEARIVEAVTRQPIRRVPVDDSATAIATLVQAALIERKGMKSEDAFAAVGVYSVRDLLASVSRYTIANPPKGDSPSETPAV